jgi:predicted Zn-dependent peptidase
VRLVGALETTEGASTFLADAVALGYPADVIDAVAAGVAQATPADVTAAARTYFSDPRASVVGDATVLAADLSSLGLGSAEVR